MTVPTVPASTSGPTVVRSLAHAGTDPPSLVRRAREALGWRGSDFLVGLAGDAELMPTLEVAADLEGLVRVGDPASPRLRLLRALGAMDAATGLRLTRVARVAQPWRWARVAEHEGAPVSGVALRQQTYSDVVDTLGRAGLTFRVLPDATTTGGLLEAAGELGSVVVDVGEVPDEALVLGGHLDELGPVTYGLLSRDEVPSAPVGRVWLSLAAESESAGTLMGALERFARLGLDLDFLHSDPRSGPGRDRHDFYLGFAGDLGDVAALRGALAEVQFSARVLGAFAAPAEPGGSGGSAA